MHFASLGSLCISLAFIGMSVFSASHANAASDFFRIWPNHPAAPVRPGPEGSAIRHEWDVEVDMRGIVANSEAMRTILVKMPDGHNLRFDNVSFSDISGFELVGEFDFQVDPDASDSDISYTWYGTSGSAQMTIAVWQGVMSATITGIPSTLSVQQMRSHTRLREFDLSRVPPEVDGDRSNDDKSGTTNKRAAALLPNTKAVVAHVDTLVVHTPAVLAALVAMGGDRSTLNAMIAEAFLQSESAMTVSGMTGTRLRNVLSSGDLSEEIPYNEVPGNSCTGGSTLTCRWVGHRIWLRTDPAVATLRNTNAADIVVMLVADADVAGIAYTQRTACGELAGYENTLGCTPGSNYNGFAYSVVSQQFINSFQVFVHETGHQLGMEHQSAPGATPSYSWSFAKTRSDNQVQTVMGGFSMTRSLQYSNPNVAFIGSGESSGDAARFNARTGDCLSPVMSTFRSPGQPAFIFWDDFETRLIPVGGC